VQFRVPVQSNRMPVSTWSTFSHTTSPSAPYPELGEDDISLLNGPNFCIELSTETTYPKLRSRGSAITDKIELQMYRLL
jgi:hypothetical protein